MEKRQRGQELEHAKSQTEIGEEDAQGKRAAHEQYLAPPPPHETQVRNKKDDGSKGARVQSVYQAGDQHRKHAKGTKTLDDGARNLSL